MRVGKARREVLIHHSIQDYHLVAFTPQILHQLTAQETRFARDEISHLSFSYSPTPLLLRAQTHSNAHASSPQRARQCGSPLRQHSDPPPPSVPVIDVR